MENVYTHSQPYVLFRKHHSAERMGAMGPIHQGRGFTPKQRYMIITV